MFFSCFFSFLMCFCLAYDKLHSPRMERDGEHFLKAEWNRESQWVSALAAGGARGEFEANGTGSKALFLSF